ncbi:hypothetical protein WMF31_37480 [Sorangium sp. So ce1036]|uniref:hypothetical protein n=1 Tax=Sorangium sp. So ce1036 TaxID=3133328 RepID=UPI003F0D8E18
MSVLTASLNGQVPQSFRVGHEGLEPSANGLRVRAEVPESAEKGAISTIEDPGIGPMATPKCAIRREPDASGTNPANPRMELVAALTEGIRASALGGDLEAARVASEALSRLLSRGETPSAAPAAPVIDLRAVQGHGGRSGGNGRR